MPAETGRRPEPPPLAPALLAAWPVIGVGALIWLAALVAAFTVPALESGRPVTVAGLGTGLLGTGIFLWQRDAAHRGTRSAQTVLGSRRNPDQKTN